MFLQASQLLHASVLILDSEERIGHIKRLIIQPDTGQLLAFGVQPASWFSREVFLSTQDVLHIEAHTVGIRGEDQLVPAQELIRVQESLERNIPVLGQAAITQAGKHLGRIDDLLVEIDTWMVMKYYIHHLLHEQILHADRVHLMTSKAIIFFDDLEGITEDARSESVAVSS